jgi:hypothetical protein
LHVRSDTVDSNDTNNNVQLRRLRVSDYNRQTLVLIKVRVICTCTFSIIGGKKFPCAFSESTEPSELARENVRMRFYLFTVLLH